MASKVRILNIIKASVKIFNVSFLTACDTNKISENKIFMKSIGVKESIIIPSRNRVNNISRYYYGILSLLLNNIAGIPSNYFYTSIINLNSNKVNKLIKDNKYDVILFEYWFSVASIDNFKKSFTPCVLDMHDILWKKLSSNGYFSNIFYKNKIYYKYLIKRYKKYEEKSWQQFNNIIAINLEEALYIKKVINSNSSMITAGTGVDLYEWPYCWKPSEPPKIIFYGSLSGKENELAALHCVNNIMPLIWNKMPNVELWLVGANPSNKLLQLHINPLIKITGFVDDVKEVLSLGTIMLCPLKGKYGFRSRLIEAMALGLPLCVSSDAVYGMNIENEKGVYICNDDFEYAKISIKFILDKEFALNQSILARKQVEEKFSFEATYGKIVSFLHSCYENKKY